MSGNKHSPVRTTTPRIGCNSHQRAENSKKELRKITCSSPEGDQLITLCTRKPAAYEVFSTLSILSRSASTSWRSSALLLSFNFPNSNASKACPALLSAITALS